MNLGFIDDNRFEDQNWLTAFPEQYQPVCNNDQGCDRAGDACSCSLLNKTCAKGGFCVPDPYSWIDPMTKYAFAKQDRLFWDQPRNSIMYKNPDPSCMLKLSQQAREFTDMSPKYCHVNSNNFSNKGGECTTNCNQPGAVSYPSLESCYRAMKANQHSVHYNGVNQLAADYPDHWNAARAGFPDFSANFL